MLTKDTLNTLMFLIIRNLNRLNLYSDRKAGVKFAYVRNQKSTILPHLKKIVSQKTRERSKYHIIIENLPLYNLFEDYFPLY